MPIRLSPASSMAVALALLVLGGLIYTAGVLVFISPKVPFRRAIWHGFVVTGATVNLSGSLDRSETNNTFSPACWQALTKVAAPGLSCKRSSSTCCMCATVTPLSSATRRRRLSL